MAKTKPSVSSKAPQPAPKKSWLARHRPSAASIRETIESVAIAFILAFLFRTFEAEAFVIPTGSMAPTLMGRHKDVKCEKCGYPYQVSASEEVTKEGQSKTNNDQIACCTCPMCRYTMEIDGRNPQPPYSGDRIIVNKFSYQFDDPKRWDVIVFYYPEGAHDNYIKRLAGLPNETLRIRFGDVWIRNDKNGAGGNEGREEFQIARKAPDKLLAMLQTVFDNDYMPAIAKYGWPVRWQSEPASSGAAGSWTSDDYITYSTDGASASEVWLRYQHLVPWFNQWKTDASGKPFVQDAIKPHLITDFTAYDTGLTVADIDDISRGYSTQNLYLNGLHWVGDLAVSATAELENNSGQVVLELVKGGRKFQCRLDAATGKAALSISGDDMQSFRRIAETNFRGPGKYNLMFSNCDRQLLLWINDSVVKFDSPATYGDLKNTCPTELDLSPVRVASLGLKMKLSHLKVKRDIYYIATNKESRLIVNRYKGKGELIDYIQLPPMLAMKKVDQFFSDPTQWKAAFDQSNMCEIEFQMKDDQYFALGDNSAKSQDSRLWFAPQIDRDLLKGKALFIYWPHTWDRIPYVNIPFPYFPNFSRMHFIK
ncbi:MAG: signal peptidase I [Thermoguttaceae bacterium]|jgi:signal peptidase I